MMKKRTFLQIALGAVAGVVMPKSAPSKEPDRSLRWEVMVCEAGTTASENLRLAQLRAKASGKEVRFSFNYHRHYCVFPNGRVERVDDALYG